MTELTIIQFPTGFPRDLCQEATETLIDPEQRPVSGRLLRTYRALLAMRRRSIAEKLECLETDIAECDRLLERFEGEPETEA